MSKPVTIKPEYFRPFTIRVTPDAELCRWGLALASEWARALDRQLAAAVRNGDETETRRCTQS